MASGTEVAQDTKPSARDSKSPPSVDQLVQYFDTIVFQSEFKDAPPSKVIKKWTQPLRLAIRAFEENIVDKDGHEVRQLQQVKVRKSHRKFIRKHLRNLIAATGLKTEDSRKTRKDPNFTINFVPRGQMANPYFADTDRKLLRRLASEGGCFFVFWPDKKSPMLRSRAATVASETSKGAVSNVSCFSVTR